MLDIKLIRNNPAEIEKKLKRREPTINLQPILDLDAERRNLLFDTEAKQNKLNQTSKQIGWLKQQGKDASQQMAEMKILSEEIKSARAKIRKIEEDIDKLMALIPNIPNDSVPVSQNKEDKIVLKEFKRKPRFGFKIKNHLELSEKLDLFNFPGAAKMSQPQFPMYSGICAQLEWALITFMIDIQVNENGYKLIIPPFLVNPQTMFTAGNLPKFEDDLYKLRDDELYLIPTSEVPLTNLHRDEILKEEDLPLKYAAYTPCFRREAGTYGADEKGLIRVHQFNKVEMYKFTTPETSDQELDGLVTDAEKIVERLDLHYRTTLLVTSDMAQQSAKTIDIEIWLPAQNDYYEVSSCSNCKSFQAIRGNTRYKPKDGTKNKYVHTLNGSGLATSRLLIAILETYQQKDGSIVIPGALRPYMKGLKKIEAEKK